MNKKSIRRILSGDYTDIGFKRGLDEAVAGEPKDHSHRMDINPLNWLYRYENAEETYSTGLNDGYNAGLKKMHDVYGGNVEQNCKNPLGGTMMQAFSLQDQMNMINSLVENLQTLKGFFGTIRDGYNQNIESSARMGLGQDYLEGLRERESRLNQTMDEIEILINQHLLEMDQTHRGYIEHLMRAVNE